MATWTDAERHRALELYVEHGPTEASRQTGIPKGTIGSWAGQAGLRTVHPEKLAAALGVQRLTLAQRRATLAERLYAEADALLDQLWEPALATHFTKDGAFTTGDLDEPTFRDKQAIVTSAAILLDKAQLLSGEATVRPELMSAEEIRSQLAERLDELAAKRAEREAV